MTPSGREADYFKAQPFPGTQFGRQAFLALGPISRLALLCGDELRAQGDGMELAGSDDDRRDRAVVAGLLSASERQIPKRTK